MHVSCFSFKYIFIIVLTSFIQVNGDLRVIIERNIGSKRNSSLHNSSSSIALGTNRVDAKGFEHYANFTGCISSKVFLTIAINIHSLTHSQKETTFKDVCAMHKE